jgi:hypothetical protein
MDRQFVSPRNMTVQRGWLRRLLIIKTESVRGFDSVLKKDASSVWPVLH